MTDTATYQLLPPLSGDEYQALKADIAENGVLVPIVKDQHGNILDGHHRVQIADELGIDYRVDIITIDTEIEGRRLARVYNLARRQLSRKQKRALIADEITDDPDRSDREIGRLLGVDHKTVGSVRRELGGEIPHPDDDYTEADIARMLADVVVGRSEGYGDKARAVAVQIAELVLCWGDGGPLPNLYYVVTIARTMLTNEVPIDLWKTLAVWLVPVARCALLECDGVREHRGCDALLPGESLARLVLALWTADADDDLRMAMFNAMEVKIAIAVSESDELWSAPDVHRAEQ